MLLTEAAALWILIVTVFSIAGSIRNDILHGKANWSVSLDRRELSVAVAVATFCPLLATLFVVWLGADGAKSGLYPLLGSVAGAGICASFACAKSHGGTPLQRHVLQNIIIVCMTVQVLILIQSIFLMFIEVKTRVCSDTQVVLRFLLLPFVCPFLAWMVDKFGYHDESYDMMAQNNDSQEYEPQTPEAAESTTPPPRAAVMVDAVAYRSTSTPTRPDTEPVSIST
jgi:hypothetical protein